MSRLSNSSMYTIFFDEIWSMDQITTRFLIVYLTKNSIQTSWFYLIPDYLKSTAKKLIYCMIKQLDCLWPDESDDSFDHDQLLILLIKLSIVKSRSIRQNFELVPLLINSWFCSVLSSENLAYNPGCEWKYSDNVCNDSRSCSDFSSPFLLT